MKHISYGWNPCVIKLEIYGNLAKSQMIIMMFKLKLVVSHEITRGSFMKIEQ